MILNNISSKNKFIAAVTIQVILLFLIIIFKSLVLTGGTDVFLRILPVDPRDPLRGDYVTFRYDISTISNYSSEKISNGDTVYVTLVKRGKFWDDQNISTTKPKEGVFIIGKVASGGIDINNMNPDYTNKQRSYNQKLTIVYGIEDYFIPEGKGRNFNFRDKEAGALVTVGSSGSAVLKKIYIDDKPWP